MTDLPYWGITAVLFWIRTRDLSYVQQLLTGDAKRDEDYCYYCFMIGKFQSPEGREKRPIVVSKEQAAAELHAKVRSGELKVAGIKCDPRNKGEPVSDTVQDIPTRDWGNLGFGLFPHDSDGSYAAFYENNRYPSWRHMVCSSVTVRDLWPAEPGSTIALSNREQAARTFLERWFKVRTIYYGAWLAAIRHVAKNCNCSEDAAKKSTGTFISAEIKRIRNAAKGC